MVGLIGRIDALEVRGRDHTDPDTILPLSEASPGARFVMPFTSRDTLADPGHFVSHLYAMNPMRPGELLYFVREADG